MLQLSWKSFPFKTTRSLQVHDHPHEVLELVITKNTTETGRFHRRFRSPRNGRVAEPEGSFGSEVVFFSDRAETDR